MIDGLVVRGEIYSSEFQDIILNVMLVAELNRSEFPQNR